MEVCNKIMLITYADSFGSNLRKMSIAIDEYIGDAIGGVHILPFYPSSADRGFAPMTYTEVDAFFGDWDSIMELSKKYYLMFDFMINHISRSSIYFKDFIEKGDESEYAPLFIRYSEYWDDGEPTSKQIDNIYKRKPRAPYTDVTFKDGKKDKVWCTFDKEQIDLDVSTGETREFIQDNLLYLSDKGASIIRLDAFAYAIKKKDTNCFFVEPEIWELLKYCNDLLKQKGVMILPEIHEHYTIQQKIADKGYYVYDFALPMLVLHALYTGRKDRLIHWLKICPRKQFTTLDAHDGIGVVDVKDLLTDKEIEETREHLYAKGANVKKIYSTSAYKNLDIYQINCTYYSALGNDDNAYLLARAIQFFTPGIPQVYYVGMLAGENDIELLEKTKHGRDINRHAYSLNEINSEVERPVVRALLTMMRFRNLYPAFNGDILISDTDNKNEIEIVWIYDEYEAILKANLLTHEFEIKYYNIFVSGYELLKWYT